MKEEAVKLHEYFVYVNTFEDFKLVLDKVNSVGLNLKKRISINALRVGYFFIDESDLSLDGCAFLERAIEKVAFMQRLLPQDFIKMLDTYNLQQKENKMKNLTLDQVYVHVPFMEITKVLLETAKNNEVSHSNFIKNHDYLFFDNNKIEAAYKASGLLACRTEVNINEFMQLILDQNIVSLKLNDNIEAFVSNKGSKVTFSFDKQSKREVSDVMIDELKLFLLDIEKSKFEAGNYCVFPSAGIRRAFARMVNNSDTHGANIIESEGFELVLFYESSNASIWLKSNESAYLAYDIKANKISMEEFAERLQFRKKLKLLGHDVTRIGSNIIKFGCQEVSRENLSALFHVICTQKGETNFCTK